MATQVLPIANTKVSAEFTLSGPTQEGNRLRLHGRCGRNRRDRPRRHGPAAGRQRGVA